MPRTIASDQDERILIIDRVIRTHHEPSLHDIVGALENEGHCHGKRTVQDDMKIMRTCYDAEIDSKRSKPDSLSGDSHYYYAYKNPGWALDIDQMTKEDLAAIALARELLKHHEGLPQIDALDRVYEKLTRLTDMSAHAKTDAGAVPAIAFAPWIRQSIDSEIWRTLHTAIQTGKAVRIEYDKSRSWDKKGQKSRLVDPYHLVNLGDIWYLIGTAGASDQALRQYKVSSVRSAAITKASSQKPRGFKIDRVLENTFGRFIGDPNDLVTVRVRFSKKVAPLVRERKFHAKEKKTEHRDGRTTVSFPVTPSGATPEWRFYHVRSWILSWGADAEVLGPPELQERVRKDIEAMYHAARNSKT